MISRTSHFAGCNGQYERGATLIVALIFLMVLALLGASALQSNSLQERMAGSTRHRNLAFQAAEAALADAGATLTTWRTSSANFDGTVAGLKAYDATTDNNTLTYWRDSYDWSDANCCKVPANTLSQVAAQPKYVAQKIMTVGGDEYYRVTARGVGGDANAVVILQAVYKWTP